MAQEVNTGGVPFFYKFENMIRLVLLLICLLPAIAIAPTISKKKPDDTRRVLVQNTQTDTSSLLPTGQSARFRSWYDTRTQQT